MRDWDKLYRSTWQWFEDKHMNDVVMQYAKLNEEVGEIAHELTRDRLDSAELVDAIGDTAVTLIGLCHHLGLDLYECLDKAYNEIKDRKGEVKNGSFVKED